MLLSRHGQPGGPETKWATRILTIGISTITACIIHDQTITVEADGYYWCADLNNAKGHPTSSDENDWFDITDPSTMDEPRGCICFDSAESAIIVAGNAAAMNLDPLPDGYTDLLDELRLAAQSKCQQIVLNSTPQITYNNCLSPSLQTSIPVQVGASGECTICLEGNVQSGSIHEVACDGGTAGDSGTGEPGTSSAGNSDGADESSSGAGFDCSGWDTTDAISYGVYIIGRPAGGYSNVHQALADQVIDHYFAGLLACDSARYAIDSSEDWVMSGVSAGDFAYEIGLRNGDKNLRVRAYDPSDYSALTPWYALDSYQSMYDAKIALSARDSIQIEVETSGSPKNLYVHVMDCSSAFGVVCPPP